MLDIAKTRLVLFSTDVQEADDRFVRLIRWSMISIFFFALGVLFVALLIVVFFWDGHRHAAVALGGGFFLLASVSTAAIIVRLARQRRNPFPAPLAELAKARHRMQAAP